MNNNESAIIAGISEHIIGHIPRTIIDYKQFVDHNNINFYKYIYNQGGFTRFFKGIVPMLSGVSLGHVVLFNSLELSKKYNTVQTDILFGIAGRFGHDIFMTPGDIIRMRSNLTNTSTVTTIKEIYKNYGYRGYFKGLNTNLFMNIPSGIIEFSVHNYMERKYGSNHLQPLYTGITTGICSSIVTNPIDTIKTCLQSNDIKCLNTTSNYNNVKETIYNIYNNRGISGFFRGSGLRCLQTSLCFTIYDYMLKKD